MAVTLDLRAEKLNTLPFGSIGATYTPVGERFSRPMRMLFIQNHTDALLMFSFDGINDHFPLPPNGFLILDVSTNDIGGAGFFLSRGTLMEVKEVDTPSSGAVYVSSFFARGT